jgi:hypothetical protein
MSAKGRRSAALSWSAAGMRYHPDGAIIYILGMSYDDNSALLIHPGLTLKW